MTPHKQHRVTWRQLVAAEPALALLAREAVGLTRATDDAPRRCANAMWYGYNGYPGLKPRLCTLVGWYARQASHPVLTSSEAYDVAYHHIYALLPSCRDCFCCFVAEAL